MAERLPIVIVAGQPKRLPAGDTLPAAAGPPRHIEVVLSAAGADIAAGLKQAIARIPYASTLDAFVIDCDPANEPASAAIQVDLNSLDRTTGTATTLLSTVASIAISANTGTGTISGTPTFAAGDMVSFDIDQGSDGKELLATLTLTPT